MLNKLSLLLEMIKFKHSVFALPFALMASFLAAGGFPPFMVFLGCFGHDRRPYCRHDL